MGGQQGGRTDRKHLLLEQFGDRQAGKAAVAPTDHRVGLAERVAARVGVHQHVDVGMARLEPPDPPHQPGRGERGGGVDHQKPPPLGLAHRARRAGELGEALGQRRCARRAGFGHAQAATGAHDEIGADLLLKQPDLLRDGRFGDEQLLRRACERKPSRDGLEGAQSVERR